MSAAAYRQHKHPLHIQKSKSGATDIVGGVEWKMTANFADIKTKMQVSEEKVQT